MDKFDLSEAFPLFKADDFLIIILNLLLVLRILYIFVCLFSCFDRSQAERNSSLDDHINRLSGISIIIDDGLLIINLQMYSFADISNQFIQL
jgi:hypothetical protein